MKQIRVANYSGGLGDSYRTLQSDPQIAYSQGSLADNISLLMANKVDAALVSTTDFALHGGCVGVDFGVVFDVKNTPQILLHAKGGLSELQAVYVKESAESVWLLLKVLLAELYHNSPRLMHLIRPKTYSELKDGEAILTFGNEAILEKSVDDSVKVFDLVAMWKDWQKLPFAALVWVTKQENLTKEDRKNLIHSLKKCQAQKDLSVELNFNSDVIAGLDKFYELCFSRELLPRVTYKNISSAMLNISGENYKKINPEILLQNTLAGQRLSVTDAVRIASKANFEDLILAADLLRNSLFSQSTLHAVYLLQGKNYRELLDNVSGDKYESPQGVSSLVIPSFSRGKVSLEQYEELLSVINAKTTLSIEGIGIKTIFSIAQLQNLTVEQTTSRLVEAGLDSVSGDGGEILLEEKFAKSKKSCLPSEWLRVVKWLHRYGAKTSCCIRVSKKDSWEDRLLHLQKLRALQDLNSGFSHFYFVNDNDWQGAEFIENYLRMVAIVRLFFDNLASISVDYSTLNRSLGVLALQCGANEIRVVANNLESEICHLQKVVEMK